MGTTTGEFIAALTERHNVIVIGGMAVIAHGFNRPTKDAYIWIARLMSFAARMNFLQNRLRKFFPAASATRMEHGFPIRSISPSPRI